MLSLILAAALSSAPQQCPQFFPGGQIPKTEAVQVCLDSFSVGYDKTDGEPLWSAQHETAASVAAGAAVKRNGTFHPCDLPDGSRSVSPAVYAKTGYDLGHMTEAAAPANKPPTFGTCNMVPQRPNLNRKIWAGIEEAVRALAAQDGEVYVISGPVIPPGAPMLDGQVAVPSYTWKAVYDPKTGTAAYLCSNTDAPVCSGESIADLTQQIAFDPFPALPDGTKAAAMKLPQPTKGGQLSN